MSDETDPIDRLKAALAADPAPEPRAEAKRTALDAALRRFDGKNAEASQGSGAEERPKARRSSLNLLGRFLMTLKPRRLRPALLGGASLAALALAVVVTTQTDMWREPTAPSAKPTSLRQESKQDGADLDRFAIEDEESALAAPALLAEESVEESAEEPAEAPGDIVVAMEQDQRRAPAPEAAQPRIQGRGMALDGVIAGEAALSEAPAPALKKHDGARSRVATGYAAGQAVGGFVHSDDAAPAYYQEQGRDRFEETEPNPVTRVAEDPVSTFSIDVDTASYSFMRKALMNGALPQKNAVRIEELVNYFSYDYAAPESRETPFKANVALLQTPWNDGTKLLRIGVRGYALEPEEKPRSNLVFLIDTSGSMNAPDKLPLLVNAFRLLVDTLEPEDTVAIVTYAGSAGTVLEPTKVSEKATILSSLERLAAGGSTAGAEGVRQAYRLAEQSFEKDGVNRVILATDGDFNVGVTDPEELKSFIERKRESGVMLSVLGFGRGNYNDALMQTLAQNGNGQAAYIDTLAEARKTLVEEAGSTLFPIAKDVKIQIEFNPARISEYRLIGYETRLLKREDFNNDRIDAGEIGSGHTVTALYEITPTGSPAELVDDLRYQQAAAEPGEPEIDDASPQDASSLDAELAFLKIRYKQPDADESRLIATPITEAMEIDPGSERAREARFAAAVAGFGQLLKGGRHTGGWSYDDAARLAEGALGPDPFGYRRELVTLVRLAKSAAALERQQ